MTAEREAELLHRADHLLDKAWTSPSRDGYGFSKAWAIEAAANVALATELRIRRESIVK